MGKVHFSDFDGRMKPIVNHYKDIPEAMANISYESYHSMNFRDFLSWMDDMQERGPGFKTWVLDSVTSASNTAIVYQLWKKDKAVKTSKAGLPVTGWDEMNAETVCFTQLLEASNYLNEKHGTNVIWIAHPVSKTDTSTDTAEARRYESIASYGYKIPSLIPTKFDEIYRLKVEKIGAEKFRRIAMTSLFTEGEIVAKTALDLPSKMDISDGLYSAIIANLKKKEGNVEGVVPVVAAKS